MRKLLGVIGSFGLVATTGVTSVVSCDKGQKSVEKAFNNHTWENAKSTDIIQKFQIEVLNVLQEDISSEISYDDYKVDYFDGNGKNVVVTHADQNFANYSDEQTEKTEIHLVKITANSGSKYLDGEYDVEIIYSSSII